MQTHAVNFLPASISSNAFNALSSVSSLADFTSLGIEAHCKVRSVPNLISLDLHLPSHALHHNLTIAFPTPFISLRDKAATAPACLAPPGNKRHDGPTNRHPRTPRRIRLSQQNPLANLRTFDAFPKTKPTYTTTTSAGGLTTLLLAALCALLTFSELLTWFYGTESHHFTVERGVSHELQLNLDVIVAMRCSDLHVNVQDAAMDRIMAGDLLRKDDTLFALWDKRRRNHARRGSQPAYKDGDGDSNRLGSGDLARKKAEEEDSHVAHVLGHMRSNPSKKFTSTPKLRRWESADACRIYGSLEGNKVQGDFHITARGHGYVEFGGPGHLQHNDFNFSHQINELSFGPHYPHLLNPLDKTGDVTEAHFHMFQYYLSIVPTIFTSRRVATKSGALDPRLVPQPPTLDMQPHDKLSKDGRVVHVPIKSGKKDSRSIFTNQYAATSQSREVAQNTIPGIFFKYDIEPILLIVSGSRSSFLALAVRLVNVISGVLVGGGWIFQLWMWVSESGLVKMGRRSMGNRRTSGFIGEKGNL